MVDRPESEVVVELGVPLHKGGINKNGASIESFVGTYTSKSGVAGSDGGKLTKRGVDMIGGENGLESGRNRRGKVSGCCQ